MNKVLSTSVRLYQALAAAGQPVELDLYEGMWHVFQAFGLPANVSLEQITVENGVVEKCLCGFIVYARFNITLDSEFKQNKVYIEDSLN